MRSADEVISGRSETTPMRRWPRPDQVRRRRPARPPALRTSTLSASTPATTRSSRTSGTPCGDQVGEVAGRGARRGDDHHAVHLPRPQRVHRAPLALGVLVGVGEEHRVAVRVHHVGQAAGGGGEERVLDVADDQADGRRRPRDERPGDRVGPVAEHARALGHLAPGGRRGVPVPAQGARGRGGRNPGGPGDVADRDGHGRA